MAYLRELREAALLTQAELATKAGINPVTLSRLENGIHPPRFRTIRALAKVLKVDPKEIEFPAMSRRTGDD
jgi:transcriptional regulator with XRE-family HTH domain